MVSYTYTDQKVVRVHATCFALWERERTAE